MTPDKPLEKCEHYDAAHKRAAIATSASGGKNVDANCYLCGLRFVPETEVLALRVELLTVLGQCTEEHHWAGKCPAEGPAERPASTDHTDLIHRLRKRAEIRRQISTRKSVQENKPDRIADLLDEAADALGGKK